MSDGLASNEVFDITQDRIGYLWIATNNGLQRYDGVHYKTFRHRPGDPQSIPSNVLVKVLNDANDNLWIVTHGGRVGFFDKNRFTYKDVPAPTLTPTVAKFGEKRLITDEFGNVFLSIRGHEVLRYDKARGEFASIEGFIPIDPKWGGFTSFSQQPGTHKYWMGLQTGGLIIYNSKTKNFSYTGHNVENEPAIEACGPTSDFAFSFFDRKGRVWFHQWGGGFPYCMQYDTKTNKLQRFEFITTLNTYHELRGFTQLSNGQVIAFGGKLFAFYNEAENQFHLVPNDFRSGQGINYESITGMFEDREKNVWIGTQENGIYCFNPSTEFFTTISHINRGKATPGNGNVMTFIETKNGDILTGVWEDGPFRYTKNLQLKGWEFRDSAKIGFPYFWDFCASADSNTIWIGAQPGLHQYNQATGTVFYRNPAALGGRTIRQVGEDKAGNLWLGMHAYGAFRWIDPKNTKKDFIIKLTETRGAMVNRLLVDKRNNVWIGTGNEGLFMYEGNTGKLIKNWTENDSGDGKLLGNSIMGILEYSDSVLIVANLTNLFSFNYNTGRFRSMRLADFLMGNINSIEKDDDGFIWMGTTNALYRFHPNLRTLVLFNRTNGMKNDRFTLSASYKLKDGRLLFGTSNSFIAFYPKAFRLSEGTSSVVLTSIQAGKRELRVDSVVALERLVLPYSDNSLAISFSSLRFSMPTLIQYKMEGIDDEWKVADRDNKATYPFLPAGNHTLLLRTLNSEGAPNPKVTTLHIKIAPPFYQTWWFYTIMGIAAAFLLFWIDRQRSKRKQSMEKVRTDIASGLHQEVNTALNNINILSEIARLKSDKEPQKAKDYLEQIHSKSHNMIIALDDMLWSLDPKNDAMDKTISRVKEYAEALMQRHGVLIELLIDKKVEKLQLNMKLRHEAFLLFKEGLRSLVEAGTKLCIVHLTYEKAKLFFTIEFENEGCDMQKLNNLLQRRDMDMRIQNLGAKLNVQLHKSKSMFLLQLPLG